MQPARLPRQEFLEEKLLAYFAYTDSLVHTRIRKLPDFLHEGDLIVVNSAATLPALIKAEDHHGSEVEIRLCRENKGIWAALIFGLGSWRQRTEDRALLSNPLTVGSVLKIGNTLTTEVIEVMGERLFGLKFNLENEDFWRELYGWGKPIQYSYLERQLNLWDVQTLYSDRPIAFEMPSAGRPLRWEILAALIRKEVQIVPLTHSAGISSTGVKTLDAQLPFAESYQIPKRTLDAIISAVNERRRIIAVGTSVVRALEGSFVENKGRIAESGITKIVLGPGFHLQIVDGILTGTHDVGESHFELLRAFLPADKLEKIRGHLNRNDYLTHEFGDSVLIMRRG